ncbi:MAG: hypothetical protein R2710_08665 [Acidimicrobiales bacterium]
MRGGLSAVEVEAQRRAGNVNEVPDRTSRSTADIVRGNVFTRFNAIISVLTAVILVFGDPIDALFAFVMVLNAAIGIIQELRAKRTLDRLRVIIAPRVTVLRDGVDVDIGPGRWSVVMCCDSGRVIRFRSTVRSSSRWRSRSTSRR